MPQRKRLHQYYRSTFITALTEVLAAVCTTDAEGEQIGLDRATADAFLRILPAYFNGAVHELRQVIAERDDDGPIELSADLVDRLAAAATKRKE